MALEERRNASVIIDRILEEVATEAGVEVLALPSLYDSIDPDALDKLLDSPGSEDVTIRFSYYGYAVHATSSGTVSIDSTKLNNE